MARATPGAVVAAAAPLPASGQNGIYRKNDTQLGVDIPLSKNMVFNVDVKKVFIRTDIHVAGTKIDTFKVNPVWVGVGLGGTF